MTHPVNHKSSGKRNGPLRSAIRTLRQKCKTRLAIFNARRTRLRSKSTFIGVTGSSGKSTATALLAHILEGHGQVLPLKPYNQLASLIEAVSEGKDPIDYVVVEAGIMSKGDMQPMAALLQPDVAIVTLIEMEHFKSFRTRQAIAEEKSALVRAIKPGGIAVLNADDDLVLSMADQTAERVVTFGRERQADYRVTHVSSSYPGNLEVEIVWRGGSIVVVSQLLGEHFWPSVAASVATALELGVDRQTILQQCATFTPLANRCQIIPTRDGPVFIVDAKKAPNASLPLAMHVVEQAIAPRKRIVLGQISDFAGNPKPKYRDAYRAAIAVADQVVFVGDNAHRSTASKEDRESGRFVELQTARHVYEHIRQTTMKDEIILLKSSNNLHLERVALAWKHDVKCWVDRCGKKIDCHLCGLYEHPFAEHAAVVRKRKNAARNDRRRQLFNRILPLK